MSTEQKRKELEAAGYVIDSWIFFDDGGAPCVESPDGIMFGHDEDEKHLAIDKAYEHLQRDTKLKALEAFVLRVHDIMGDILDKGNSWQEVETYENADDLIKQYNITADDESDNE